MTPAEQTAQQRSHAVALIQEHAPPRLQQSLIELLRPAISLNVERCDDDLIPVGASKFGGAPDVAAGFEWPKWNEKPLGFLAQISLEEVAPFDVEGLLPASGLLSFFYGMQDGEDWPYSNEDEGGWRVYHFPQTNLTRLPWPEELHDLISLRSAAINFEPLWSYTSWFDFAPDILSEFSPEEYDAIYQLEKSWKKAFPAKHQMLGHPNLIQDDPRYAVAINMNRGTTKDWRLLLQVDTDDEINFDFCCCGRVWFVIHQDDLKNENFADIGYDGQQ